jgi:hypothetical protein
MNFRALKKCHNRQSATSRQFASGERSIKTDAARRGSNDQPMKHYDQVVWRSRVELKIVHAAGRG